MDLDDVIPNPRYRICHSRVARAPLPAVWDALHRVTMSALPLGHALEGMRILPARLSGKKPGPLAGRSFLDVTPIPVLFSDASGHEKIRVCGQLAPGSRSSEFQSCGHLRSVWLAMCSLPVSGVS